MMDERRVEAALRDAPPDEPMYRGRVATELRARSRGARRDEDATYEAEVVQLTARRRRPVLALCAAVAATILLLVALAVIARPQHSPTAAIPTSASAPSKVSAELVGRWVGPTPDVVTTPSPSAPAFVVISEDRLSLEHLGGGIVLDFSSQLEPLADGELLLTLTGQTGRCRAGAAGRYRWTLSPKASTLTLEAIVDSCANRAAALVGDWALAACPALNSDCLGPLEAGRHSSVAFDPFGSNSYGEVAYNVPAGWSSTFDDRTRLTLLPPGGNTSGTHGVYLFADVMATTVDCSATADGLTTSATAIAANLHEQAGLSVTTRAQNVGDYEAQVLDILSASSLPCTGTQPLLVSRPGGPTAWTVAIGQDQRMRIELVDLPGGRTLAVVVASDRSATEYAQLLDSAETLIDSIVLSPTP